MDEKRDNSKFFLIVGIVVLFLVIAGAVFWLNSGNETKEKPTLPSVSDEEDILDVTSGGCEKLGLSFNTQQAYSCFDNANNLVKIYVSRSSENVILKKIDFIIFSNNGSINYSSSYGLAPSSFYVYPIPYTLDNVQKIEIIPTVQDNGGQKTCESLFVNYLSSCVAEEVISIEPEPEYYYDENLEVVLVNATSPLSNITNETSDSGISATTFSSNKPQKKIVAFSLDSVSGEIDDVRHRVFVKFQDNRSLKYLVPSISVSENASVSPLSGVGKDFTIPVNYIVKATDNSTQQYTVYVSNYIEEIVEIPEQSEENQSQINLTEVDNSTENISEEDCPNCSESWNGSGLNYTDYENETPVAPSFTLVTNLSGTVAGTWSTNLSAASQIAQMNKKFYIINYGNLQSCSYCTQAENNIFNKEEFKQWAYSNGIAMIYASSKYESLDPTKTIRQRYVNPLLASGVSIGFPFIIIVGYENTNAVASFTYRKGYNINGVKANLTVTDFIKIVDSYTGKYRVNVTAVSAPVSSIGAQNFNYSSLVNWTVVSAPVISTNSVTHMNNYGIYNTPYLENSAIATSGSVAGRWTYDLAAAKALAKANGKFYIVNYGKTSGCSSCTAADLQVYNRADFTKWAMDNGIPLVYANRVNCENTCTYPEPGVTIKRLYLSGTINFPTVLVIDGSGNGTRMLGKFELRESAIGAALSPQNFVSKIKSVVQNYTFSA